MDWLHTDGIYIKDQSNRIVPLRIISLAYNMPVWGNFEETWTWVLDQAKAQGVRFIELRWTHLGSGYTFIELVEGSETLLRLDRVIEMCEARNLRVILNYQGASSVLIRDGYATGWQDVIPIEQWVFLIQRYVGRPVVCGVKLIDEPNFKGLEERQMWINAINALKPYNPKLLWETYVISYQRLAEWSLERWVWVDKSGVPPNVFHGGGAGVKLPDEPTVIHIGLDDYATAEQLANDIPQAIISNYRNEVQIPCLFLSYSNHLDIYPNAHWTFLQKTREKCDQTNLGFTLLLGIHHLFTDYKQDILPRIFVPAPKEPVKASALMVVIAILLSALVLWAVGVKSSGCCSIYGGVQRFES